jgi:capsule polysaccharide export protein KpsE/RkpR
VGILPDPRDAQIARLKAEIDALRNHIARQSATIENLSEFKTLALSRIAAQHEEIARLRDLQTATGTPAAARLMAVPRDGQTIGSCS